MNNLIFLLSALALFSCGHSGGKTSIKTYFDLDSLLDTQMIRSGQSPLQFDKEVILDDQSERNTVSFDSVTWAKELGILRDFTINKADYVGAYEEKRDEQAITYSLKPGENSPVKTLQIYLEKGAVSRIGGLFFEDKSIYQHERTMSVLFENGEIASYEFKGFQKMIMKDSISYSVLARSVNP